jgi:hypothetical protein
MTKETRGRGVDRSSRGRGIRPSIGSPERLGAGTRSAYAVGRYAALDAEVLEPRTSSSSVARGWPQAREPKHAAPRGRAPLVPRRPRDGPAQGHEDAPPPGLWQVGLLGLPVRKGLRAAYFCALISRRSAIASSDRLRFTLGFPVVHKFPFHPPRHFIATCTFHRALTPPQAPPPPPQHSTLFFTINPRFPLSLQLLS